MEYRQPFTGSYPITQKYGDKYTSEFHTGIDYALPEGTPVLASEEGRVVACGWDRTGYGNYIIIYHPDGNGTLYAHLSKIVVYKGEKVERSQVIGYSGNTGNSTGAHLHFEARRNWTDYKSHFNPMDLPLHSSIEQPKENTAEIPHKEQLFGADKLGHDVQVVAPLGAWAWSLDFSKRQTSYPDGTKLIFTGKTTERLGYQYCECYPEPVMYWVAVNDHETQILANQKGGENADY